MLNPIPWSVNVSVAPVMEPVSLGAAMTHLRVDPDVDDVVIASMITNARDYIERSYGLALITQTVDYYLDDWPACDPIHVPRSPMMSTSPGGPIISITYFDDLQASAVMPAADYETDAFAMPGRISLARNASWPSVSLRNLAGVRIRYLAGYGGTGESVPGVIISSLLLFLSDLYEHRHEFEEGIPADRILAPRRRALMAGFDMVDRFIEPR